MDGAFQELIHRLVELEERVGLPDGASSHTQPLAERVQASTATVDQLAGDGAAELATTAEEWAALAAEQASPAGDLGSALLDDPAARQAIESAHDDVERMATQLQAIKELQPVVDSERFQGMPDRWARLRRVEAAVAEEEREVAAAEAAVERVLRLRGRLVSGASRGFLQIEQRLQALQQ